MLAVFRSLILTAHIIVFLISLLIATSLAPQALAKYEKDNALKQFSVSDALTWFPSDTETLIGYRNFSLPKISAEDDTCRSNLFGWAVGPLQDNEKLMDLVIGREIILALEGSKNFRSPNGEAGNLYDGCHIIQFKEALPDQFWNQCQNEGRTQKIHNYDVVRIDTEWGGELKPIYLSLPCPNFLLIATDKEYFSEILAHMADQPKQSKILKSKRPKEWDLINSDKQYWAIRCFKKPPKDMPFLFAENPIKQKDLPVAVVAQLDGAEMTSLNFVLIGPNDRVTHLVEKVMTDMSNDNCAPSISNVSKTMWKFELKDQETSCEILGMLEMLLGHTENI